MYKTQCLYPQRTAFTLIEMAMVLGFVGIIAGFILSMKQTTTTKDCYTATKAQIQDIRSAVERFAMTNDRFPMPARRHVGVDSPQYGREVAMTDISQLDQVTDGTKVAVFGAIPFQALGIPAANASDCWNNKYTYIVTKDLADPAKVLDPADNTLKTKFDFLNPIDGAIDVKTNDTTMQHANAGYVIISHGEDEYGAVKDNYTGTDHKWCTKTNGKLGTYNCDVSDNIVISTIFNNGKDAGNNYFDDIITIRGKPWRIRGCCYWGCT